MDKDFLLETATSQTLFHHFASEWPICDYHCHISPDVLAENKNFSDLADVWLGGDHYKWRAMRLAGIPERLITGDADPEEKFMAWAELLPWLAGNPLHHWTNLELQRYFGIDEPLTSANAKTVWQKANDALSRPDFRPLQLLEKLNVRWLCTTDDPLDTLEPHAALAKGSHLTKVLPAFRPDRFFKLDQLAFTDWVNQLGEITQQKIESFEGLSRALALQIDRFNQQGCRLSDHAFDVLPGTAADKAAAERSYAKRLNGEHLSHADIACFRATLLSELAAVYSRHDWTMQLHIGAKRNASSRGFKALGPDTGFDVIQDYPISDDLVTLLDDLERSGRLPRTLLFSLNAKDNMTMSTIASAFAKDGAESWVSLGPAWWFHDQLDGMILHLKQLCQVGVLKTFVGMTTDSRSLLSYTRHEYFRRLFCNELGNWIENGQLAYDEVRLHELIGRVCYQNAEALVKI